MTAVQTASFRDSATFQRATVDRNSLGEAIETWGTLAVRKVQYFDVQDGESIRAAAVGAQLTARMQVRWSSALDTLNARDRVVFRGRTYSISGVKVVERNRLLEVSLAVKSDIAAAATP